ncbi:MAG TPA: IclR family transcriptional regulator [Aggregatilineaceae bacterium]|nr:IclR family transcriptional regulator [Aggregatilineaceae bacterium]
MAEIQSLARGLKIMELLSAAENGISITELADQIGVDKSSASRLVRTLAIYGYAEQDTATRRYRLGPQIVRLSRSLLTRMPLRDQAKPFLRQLVERTGECSHLAILAQGQALYIDQVESLASLRVNTGVGTLAPLHCTALGKCLLAFGNAPILSELPAFTPRTITDPATLRIHLDQTRRQGYAVDDEEYEYGVRCVAAPVFDFRGKVVGAMGISGPAGRIGLEQLPQIGAIVMEASRALSNRLSFLRS